MKLHSHILGPFDLKDAHGPLAVVVDLGVGVVVHYDNLVVLCEVYELFEECPVGRCSRGVVRIVEEDQLGLPGRRRVDCIQVWQESVLDLPLPRLTLLPD